MENQTGEKKGSKEDSPVGLGAPYEWCALARRFLPETWVSAGIQSPGTTKLAICRVRIAGDDGYRRELIRCEDCCLTHSVMFLCDEDTEVSEMLCAVRTQRRSAGVL